MEKVLGDLGDDFKNKDKWIASLKRENYSLKSTDLEDDDTDEYQSSYSSPLLSMQNINESNENDLLSHTKQSDYIESNENPLNDPKLWNNRM